jgi:hypothetical protein
MDGFDGIFSRWSTVIAKTGRNINKDGISSWQEWVQTPSRNEDNYSKDRSEFLFIKELRLKRGWVGIFSRKCYSKNWSDLHKVGNAVLVRTGGNLIKNELQFLYIKVLVLHLAKGVNSYSKIASKYRAGRN